MTSVEQRLHIIEDRQALQDVITRYLVAVDELASIDAVLNCFTKDAVFDMSGINYPSIAGADALRDFFSDVFNNMTHHAHYATNFTIDTLEATSASARTHVIGMGVTKDNSRVKFYLQYHLRYRRCGDSWKISSFRGQALMPLD